MKLEFKHLASYLPFKLKYKFASDNVYYDLIGLDFDYLGLTHLRNGEKGYSSIELSKPILFPLLSLTKEITINGETFVPIYKIYEFEQWDTDELEEIINDGTIEGIYNDLNLIPYSHAEKLFEWKIDVFGLIDAGLAEPVTEDFNPYK